MRMIALPTLNLCPCRDVQSSGAPELDPRLASLVTLASHHTRLQQLELITGQTGKQGAVSTKQLRLLHKQLKRVGRGDVVVHVGS